MGRVLLATSFDNHWWTVEPRSQSYPDTYPAGDYPPRRGRLKKNTLGYTDVDLGQTPYTGFSTLFPTLLSSIQIDFVGPNELMDNESWGLDNVVVAPEPSTTMLLLAGIAGLAISKELNA